MQLHMTTKLDRRRARLHQPIPPKTGSATRMSDGETQQRAVGPDLKQDLVGKSPQQALPKLARAGVILCPGETLWSRFDLFQKVRETFEKLQPQAGTSRLVPIKSGLCVSFRVPRQFNVHRCDAGD